MVFTRKKSRAVENPESPTRTQPGTNICEGINPRRTVFTREQNDFFIQRVLQYSQEEKIDELRYNFLGLNESSTEGDMQKSYCSLAL